MLLQQFQQSMSITSNATSGNGFGKGAFYFVFYRSCNWLKQNIKYTAVARLEHKIPGYPKHNTNEL